MSAATKRKPNKWHPIDLYLYRSSDSDLIELWQKFSSNVAVGSLVFIALATTAMTKGQISISDLVQNQELNKRSKKENAIIIRIRINTDNYPNLVNLCKSLPRKSRSRTFIALVRSEYKNLDTKIDVAKLISQDSALIAGQLGEEVIMEGSADQLAKKYLTADDQLGFPDDDGIDTLMKSLV